MGNIIEETQLSLKIKQAADDIISFASSYELDKYSNKQKKQQSKSSSSPSQVADSLDFLWNQILNNNKYNEVIMIPNLLRSLIKLSIYKIGVHFSKEQDQESFAVRSSSRICLSKIQLNGNKQVQAKLVNVRYARVMIIAISATGGIGEQQDDEIKYQLKNIYQFFYCLHLGRNDQYPLPTFSPLPLLAKTCLDRNEEEGGNEEVDAQLSNSGKGGNIKLRANQANGLILNFYIDRKNTRPRWYH